MTMGAPVVGSRRPPFRISMVGGGLAAGGIVILVLRRSKVGPRRLSRLAGALRRRPTSTRLSWHNMVEKRRAPEVVTLTL